MGVLILPRETGTFERTCWPVVTYLRMIAFRIVSLPPLVNVLVQRTRPTNAFAAVRGGKTAMRTFAKLLVFYGRRIFISVIYDISSCAHIAERVV